MDLIEAARNYVQSNIGSFHAARLEKIKTLKLKSILKRKNPYLFRAKNILDASEFIESILAAYLSSQEETIFGSFLERLAIHLAGLATGGIKSSTIGVDLEFTRAGVRYLVAIKSGPNWGNSSQIAKMVTSFNTAKKVLATSGGALQVRCINGCCYGTDNEPIKATGYEKLCGQQFWELVSGDSSLYLEIIEPFGHQAKHKNEEFMESYAAVKTNLIVQFAAEYCNNGIIDWKKIASLVSGKK